MTTNQLVRTNENCCGCELCVEICPKHAISMKENEQGFRVPEIDEKICVDCGLCMKRCTLNREHHLSKPLFTYAATALNTDISKVSSSGGIFGVAASWILENNGAVFATAWEDDFEARVICVTEKDKLTRQQGSKYVQSSMNHCYGAIKEHLQSGKMVLFCGVPCQIEAVRSYLGKEYENLFLIDIVCHGVPSSKMFHDYLALLAEKKHMQVIEFLFRDKNYSQDHNGKVVYRQDTDGKVVYRQDRLPAFKSSYYKLFLRCATFRESCYDCAFAGMDRVGDLTCCDYWGIDIEHPEFSAKVQEKNLCGISAVMINSPQGELLFRKIESLLLLTNSNVEQVARHNPQLVHPSECSNERHHVMNMYAEKGYHAVDRYYREKYRLKIITSTIGQFLPYRFKRFIIDAIKHIRKAN